MKFIHNGQIPNKQLVIEKTTINKYTIADDVYAFSYMRNNTIEINQNIHQNKSKYQKINKKKNQQIERNNMNKGFLRIFASTKTPVQEIYDNFPVHGTIFLFTL